MLSTAHAGGAAAQQLPAASCRVSSSAAESDMLLSDCCRMPLALQRAVAAEVLICAG
jgi:hypothetical protein